jgi:AraC-like DNA-binding protein/mannose-6-phosphate isomerase-like protein (cupin superfamily)
MKHTVLSENETNANGAKKQYDIFRNYHKAKRLTGDVHTHTYFETVLVTEGELCYCFSDREPIRLTAGDVIFVPSNVIHQTRQSSGGTLRSVVVKFSPMFLYPMETTQSDVECLVMPPIFCEDFYVFRADTARARELAVIMQDALREVEQQRLGYELALRGRLASLLTTLLRCCSSIIPSQAETGENEGTMGSSREFYQIMVYLRENFQYNISMQEVAEVFGMSYYHFSRFFKKLTSKKFNEYLLELRLNSAQKKLLEENKSVSEVALECGFEYVSYFIQKFKERNGLTPREFQRKYRTAGQDPILLDRIEQTGVGFSTATVAPGNAVAASARAEGADAAETDSET